MTDTLTEQEIKEIEERWGPGKSDIQDLIDALRQERLAKEHACQEVTIATDLYAKECKATERLAEQLLEDTDGCPNQHESLCESIPWCDFTDPEDMADEQYDELKGEFGEDWMPEGWCSIRDGLKCWLKLAREKT
jgi:hypothetical protein